MPCTQTDWSWDCLTPYKALTGRSVSASAYAFSREFSITRVSFGPTFHRATENVRGTSPPRRGLRGQVSEPGSAN